jgi:hypothetical protein
VSGGRIHSQTVSTSLTGFGKVVCFPQYCLPSILIQGGLIRFHVGKCLTYTGATFREVSKGGGMCFESKLSRIPILRNHSTGSLCRQCRPISTTTSISTACSCHTYTGAAVGYSFYSKGGFKTWLFTIYSILYALIN